MIREIDIRGAFAQLKRARASLIRSRTPPLYRFREHFSFWKGILQPAVFMPNQSDSKIPILPQQNVINLLTNKLLVYVTAIIINAEKGLLTCRNDKKTCLW